MNKELDEELKHIPVIERQRAMREENIEEKIVEYQAQEEEKKELENEIVVQIAPHAKFTMQLRLDPEAPHTLTLRKDDIKYDGPKLTPEMENQLKEQLQQLVLDAYRAIAREMGLTLREENGNISFLDQANNPISLEQRLRIEEQLPNVFNNLPSNKNFVMISNGLTQTLQNLLTQKENQQNLAPEVKSNYKSPSPFKDPLDLRLRRE